MASKRRSIKVISFYLFELNGIFLGLYCKLIKINLDLMIHI